MTNPEDALGLAIAGLSPKEKFLYSTGEMIFKTDGHGNLVLVDNPDRYNPETQRRRKVRFTATNRTPKKKKRK